MVILIGGTLLAFLLFGSGGFSILAQEDKIEPENQVIEIPVSVMKVFSSEAGFSFLEKTVVFSPKIVLEREQIFQAELKKSILKLVTAWLKAKF